jgi:hypothetical protein
MFINLVECLVTRTQLTKTFLRDGAIAFSRDTRKLPFEKILVLMAGMEFSPAISTRINLSGSFHETRLSALCQQETFEFANYRPESGHSGLV